MRLMCPDPPVNFMQDDTVQLRCPAWSLAWVSHQGEDGRTKTHAYEAHSSAAARADLGDDPARVIVLFDIMDGVAMLRVLEPGVGHAARWK